jgi:hypothetical protein
MVEATVNPICHKARLARTIKLSLPLFTYFKNNQPQNTLTLYHINNFYYYLNKKIHYNTKLFHFSIQILFTLYHICYF